MTDKQLIKDMLNVFADTTKSIEELAKYFSPNFIQVSDGHSLGYKDFLVHVGELRNVMKSINFKIEQIASENGLVATHHIATGIKQNGKTVKTEFFAFFTLKDNKIVNCQEVSRMLQGENEDKDLSYRH
jgi:hypothetical protein